MTQAEAAVIVKAKYPKAVVREVWNPKAGRNWFKVISEPIEWKGGLDGSFAHVDLSKPCPKLIDAVKCAAKTVAS